MSLAAYVYGRLKWQKMGKLPQKHNKTALNRKECIFLICYVLSDVKISFATLIKLLDSSLFWTSYNLCWALKLNLPPVTQHCFLQQVMNDSYHVHKSLTPRFLEKSPCQCSCCWVVNIAREPKESRTLAACVVRLSLQVSNTYNICFKCLSWILENIVLCGLVEVPVMKRRRMDYPVPM